MTYSQEPEDKTGFTAQFDQFYAQFAPVYAQALKFFPFWRRWISHVLPFVQGLWVLEVSFGTGSLLSRYEPSHDVVGVEYNWEMIGIARQKINKHSRSVSLQQGDVYHLPFRNGAFDTVVTTMAFTGYPDGQAAMAELSRVLRDGGRLVMVDINYPHDRRLLGTLLTRMWMALGDIVRDMQPLFHAAGFEYRDEEIGGWGSVHLYVATKALVDE